MSEAPAQASPPPQQAAHVYPGRRAVLWGARVLGYVVYAYLVVTEIVLALGFVLLLFGANPEPSFVQTVYRSLERAMEPFRGIFTSIELGQTSNNVEAVLDTSILFAMVVYGLVAWAVQAGLSWLSWRIARLDTLDQQYQRELGRHQSSPNQSSAGQGTPTSTAGWE